MAFPLKAKHLRYNDALNVSGLKWAKEEGVVWIVIGKVQKVGPHIQIKFFLNEDIHKGRYVNLDPEQYFQVTRRAK